MYSRSMRPVIRRASCHLFGNSDGLAWDLGNGNGVVKGTANVFITVSPAAEPFEFHPLKGPMTTQSMRGLVGHGPIHWRGDRAGLDRQPGETLEESAFKEFNEAFEAFMARDGQLDAADMRAFTDFTLQLSYPPNPIRNLDGSLTSRGTRGRQLCDQGVVRQQTGRLVVCQRCHAIDPVRGLFGTAGLTADNSQPGERNFKIPHFRNR